MSKVNTILRVFSCSTGIERPNKERKNDANRSSDLALVDLAQRRARNKGTPGNINRIAISEVVNKLASNIVGEAMSSTHLTVAASDATSNSAAMHSNSSKSTKSQPALKMDGEHLDLQDIVDVARHNRPICLMPSVMSEVQRGFDLTLEAAMQAKPVYGLTVGTGWNKDQQVFSMVDGKRVIGKDLMARSADFNIKSIRAHSAGVGDPMSPEIVRAGMLIRLHTMLKGNCGVQPDVVKCLEQMLNHGIVPVVPSTGTVGQADPLLASHIGLVMSGEWEVLHEGKRKPTREVMAQCGIKPVQLVGKDFLSILSTNALMAGSAALGVRDAEDFIKKHVEVFSLCLEAFNGNISPFLKTVADARPFPHMQDAARSIRHALAGSDLWKPSNERALQDPISFRGMPYYLGDVQRGLADARKALEIQVNHSDDNPYIALDKVASSPISEQEATYLVNYNDQKRGAIYPTAHFESLPFVSPLEQLISAMSTLSSAITNNIIRLEEPEKTHLPRFLTAPGNPGQGFGGIQKAAVALHDKNLALSTPAKFSGLAVAGRMEDMGTTSGIAVENLHKMTDNLYSLASIQIL